MKLVLSVVGSVIVAAALHTVVFAQTPAQPKPGATATQPDQQVTLVGCVQPEADYRKAQDKGRGGAAGTGVGAGNEFVLTNASMGKQGLNPGTPADAAYELTGANEEKVKEFVGKRVEITGKLKPAEVTPSGAPTGGATAGAPPRGVDVASKDLQLRELEVISVAPATGTCPAQ
jgi:hypothetical protein